MKMFRFLTALLALFVLACSFGAQGQYATSYSTTSQTSSGIASSSISSTSSYSEYYTMPIGSYPTVHVSASVPYNINTKPPSTVYYGSQNQAMPYAQYMSSGNAGVNSLWIQGSTNWTQSVEVPQGATVTLIATTPAGGRGYLDEIVNGLMYNFDQDFYPGSQMTFYANEVGQHTLYFMLNGQPSNKVYVYVTGPSNYEPLYYPYLYYYPGYYSDYYPSYYPGYYPRYYRDYGQTVIYSFGYSSY